MNCSEIITAPGAVDGWLKVGHVVDGEFVQLFGYEDTAGLGVGGAIDSAQGQGYCSIPQPSPGTTDSLSVAPDPVGNANPHDGVDPMWGLLVLGLLGTGFVVGVVGVYRSATERAKQRQQFNETRLAYPTAGITEPNPFGQKLSPNPFARALDEYALMDDEPGNLSSTESEQNYQEAGYMVQVYPDSHHRTTTPARHPQSDEVVGVVVDSHHRTTAFPTTAPPPPKQASTDPFDYAPFSFFANSVSPYERACVWVALGEKMSQRDALEKIYGMADSQKNSTNWVKARDRFQDIKFGIEQQLLEQQEGD
ncbi:MAG: hypothetical protein AAF635_12600 [Cyanobacteria bacterium P01_C01_bin.69]